MRCIFYALIYGISLWNVFAAPDQPNSRSSRLSEAKTTSLNPSSDDRDFKAIKDSRLASSKSFKQQSNLKTRSVGYDFHPEHHPFDHHHYHHDHPPGLHHDHHHFDTVPLYPIDIPPYFYNFGLPCVVPRPHDASPKTPNNDTKEMDKPSEDNKEKENVEKKRAT